MEIQEFEYLDNEKRFLDEIKSIFRNYFNAVIWLKKKKKRKVADKSFKGCVRYIFASLFYIFKIERF